MAVTRSARTDGGRARARLVLIAVGVIGLTIATGLTLLTRPGTSDRLCSLGLSVLGRQIGLKLEAASCRLDPLRADMEISGLQVTDPKRSDRRLQLPRVRMRLSPLQALAGGLQIDRLEVESPQVSWALDAPTSSLPPPLPGAPCWVQALGLARLDHLLVRDGQVTLTLGGDRLALQGVQVESTRASGTYRARGRAMGEVVLAALGRAVRLDELATEVTLSPRADRATLKNAVLRTEGLELALDGNIAGLCRPHPDLAFSLKADVAKWVGLALPKVADPKGTVELSGRVTESQHGPWPQATVDAHLSGVALAGYRLPETDLNLRADASHITIDRAHLVMDKGTVDARGELGLGGKFPLNIDADLRGVTFAPTVDRLLLRHSHVDFRADAHAHVSGQIRGFALAGDVTGDIAEFTVDEEAWDHAGARVHIFAIPPMVHFQSGLRVDGDKFRFERAVFRSPEGEVDASASIYYDGSKGLRLSAEFPKVSLTELRSIAGLPWRGGGTLSGNIAGPYDDLRIEGRVELSEFELAGVDFGAVSGPMTFHGSVLGLGGQIGHFGSTRYSASGSIDFSRDLFTDGEVRVEDGRLEDLIGVIEGLDPTLREVRAVLRGPAKGQGRIHGPFLHSDAEIRLTTPSFELFQRRFSAGVLSADLRGGRVTFVRELSARIGEGGISLAGTVTSKWQVALQTQALGVPLGALLQTSESRKPPVGTATIAAEGAITGELSDLQPAGKLTLANLVLFGVPLGKANLDVTTDHRVLRFSGAAGDELTTTGSIRLAGQGAFEATVRGETRHLEGYLAGAGVKDPPSGSLTGVALLRGDFLAPEHADADVKLSHLEFAKRHLKLASEGPVHILLDHGSFKLASTVLTGGHSRLEVSGSISPDERVDASLSGDLDLRLLEGFIPQVERLSGLLHLSASLHGPSQAPLVVGSASLAGGQFSWIGLPLTARHVEGAAQFSHRKVLLSNVHGELNGGEASLAGEASLDGFRVSRYALTADLSEVPLRIPESIPSRVRGRLTLTGEPDRALTLGGEVHVEYARFNQAMDLDALLEQFRLGSGSDRTDQPIHIDLARALGTSQGQAEAPLRFDIRLIADGDIRAENNIVQLPLNGDVRLTGTVDSPGLVGKLEGRDGIADFRGYQYHVTQALFSFEDRERINPFFDVSADTDARQYRVFVHVFGTAQDYKLQLRSQPALTEDDILKLMTFGVTSQDTAGLGGNMAKAGYLGDVLWNVSGLHDQVRRVIPHNQLIRDLSVNLSSAYIQATGQVEPVAQIESRVLTDQLKIRAQLPLAEPTGKRAQAEYQLTDHLSLQAEWNNDYSDYSVGDFGLDMRARWEFGD
jgi:translocation and assembly module TamB